MDDVKDLYDILGDAEVMKIGYILFHAFHESVYADGGKPAKSYKRQ